MHALWFGSKMMNAASTCALNLCTTNIASAGHDDVAHGVFMLVHRSKQHAPIHRANTNTQTHVQTLPQQQRILIRMCLNTRDQFHGHASMPGSVRRVFGGAFSRCWRNTTRRRRRAGGRGDELLWTHSCTSCLIKSGFGCFRASR